MYRFIRSQGDLDGACFLYTVFNCAQTLLEKKLKPTHWARLVDASSSPLSLLGGGGTALIDEQDDLLRELTASYLSILGCPAKVSLLVDLRDGLLPQRMDENSALILDDGAHWYCMVEASKDMAYVACSAVWQENPNKYKELKSPRLQRRYNLAVDARDMTFFRHRAFLVRRVIG